MTSDDAKYKERRYAILIGNNTSNTRSFEDSDGFSRGAMILTEKEAARVLRFSVRTLQRLRLDGEGPAFIQLSERRIAYAVTALEAWITDRQVASTSAATMAKRGRA